MNSNNSNEGAAKAAKALISKSRIAEILATCDRHTKGLTELRAVRMPERRRPPLSIMLRWVEEKPDFATQHAKAVDIWAQFIREEILEIADGARPWAVLAPGKPPRGCRRRNCGSTHRSGSWHEWHRTVARKDHAGNQRAG